MKAKPGPAFINNMFIGHAVMMKKQCISIMRAEATRPEAVELAAEIYDKAAQLELALRKGIIK